MQLTPRQVAGLSTEEIRALIDRKEERIGDLEQEVQVLEAELHDRRHPPEPMREPT